MGYSKGMNRLLITGSEGFLGKKLINRLENSDFEIYTIDKLPSSRANHLASEIESIKFCRLVDEFAPNIVVHLAAQTDVLESIENPIQDLKDNVSSTVYLLSKIGSRGFNNFVYANSGGAIYDYDKNLPASEENLTRPLSPYGVSKLAAELYVEMFSKIYDFSWTSLAFSNIYGDFSTNKKGIMYAIWQSYLHNKPLTVNNPSSTRDFLYIDDAVSAIIAAIEGPTNCRVNISTGIETSIANLLAKFEQLLGRNIEACLRH